MNQPLRSFLIAAVGLLAVAGLAMGQPAAAPPVPPASLPLTTYLTWQRDPVTTMTVHWHTDWTVGFADSALEFRAAGGEAGWTRTEGLAQAVPYSNRMVHTVELTGLRGDTRYEFRLGRLLAQGTEGALGFHPHGPVQAFRTLPATLSRPVRFISGGDVYGLGHEALMTRMNRVAARRDPDFALLGGDIAYVDNRPSVSNRWFEFFRVWSTTMLTTDGRMIPVLPAIGNHEAHGDTYLTPGGSPQRGVTPNRALIFYTVFAFPGRPGYTALDAGDYLSLIALDTFHTNPVPGPQTDWLRGTLAARRSVPFVVPFYHVPAYPSHRAFAGATSVAVRANWVPLFDEFRVPFVFENHDHAYKVTHPLRGGQRHPDGTRYLGDGAWAVDIRPTHPLDQATYLERAQTRNHVFEVTLHPDRADIVAVDPEGVEFDTFAIKPRR